MHKNLKQVGQVTFGRGALGQLDAILAEDHLVAPLHKHDCPPISDGAVAVVLAADDRARELTDNPAWIRGLEHRIDMHALGLRDLTDSPSTRLAAEGAGAHRGQRRHRGAGGGLVAGERARDRRRPRRGRGGPGDDGGGRDRTFSTSFSVSHGLEPGPIPLELAAPATPADISYLMPLLLRKVE